MEVWNANNGLAFNRIALSFNHKGILYKTQKGQWKGGLAICTEIMDNHGDSLAVWLLSQTDKTRMLGSIVSCLASPTAGCRACSTKEDMHEASIKCQKSKSGKKKKIMVRIKAKNKANAQKSCFLGGGQGKAQLKPHSMFTPLFEVSFGRNEKNSTAFCKNLSCVSEGQKGTVNSQKSQLFLFFVFFGTPFVFFPSVPVHIRGSSIFSHLDTGMNSSFTTVEDFEDISRLLYI